MCTAVEKALSAGQDMPDAMIARRAFPVGVRLWCRTRTLPRSTPEGHVRSQFARYRQIAEVLTRHGLGFLVGVTGLARWIPIRHGAAGHERRAERYSTPEHLRRAPQGPCPT